MNIISEQSRDELARILLDLNSCIPTEDLFPAKSPDASKLITTDPFAFFVAACLNRGKDAETIWSIPLELKISLGHLDPRIISAMKLQDLRKVFDTLKYKPRYINDAPRTIHDLSELIIDECNGITSNIWIGKRSQDVKRALMAIHGVGQGISNMIIILIEKAFSYRFSDLDRKHMDIKPDIHTRFVLSRLGIAGSDSDIEAIEAARYISPDFPGGIDGPLWWIGKKLCHTQTPYCAKCPLTVICKKKI